MKAKRLIALLLAGVMVLGNATTAYAESESASMTSEFAGNVIQSDDKTDTASVEGGETKESQDSKIRIQKIRARTHRKARRRIRQQVQKRLTMQKIV